ncbi:MAG: tRNA (adenine(22)-N(1))-methyltransferase [Limnochordia bacterium]
MNNNDQHYLDILPKRLGKLLEYVPPVGGVLDVGTDHALLPIALVRRGQEGLIIASDNRRGPLAAARHNLQKYHLEHRIELRLGDGLEVLSGPEVDVVVIAGMGGQNMMEILSTKASIARQIPWLILQPMRDADQLRHWLVDNGFPLGAEDIVEDKYLYEIIIVGPGPNPPVEELAKEIGVSPRYLIGVGPWLVAQGHPFLPKLLQERQVRLHKLVEQLEAGGRAPEKVGAIKKDLSQQEQVIKWLLK